MTDSYHEVAKKLIEIVADNAATIGVGVADIYYGDQNNIPRCPTVCVDPGDKKRELNGAPRRVMTTMTNYIIVYHNQVSSMQEVREDSDILGETIEALIHADATLEGIVIDSMVTAVESGYLQRDRALFRASRLTVEARDQVQLPA